MQPPIVNEQERHILQALLVRGAMTAQQLAELCKNAFGWSGRVIRRTQQSLLNQGLIAVREGLLTPTVTKEDLENADWNRWVGSSFEQMPPAQEKRKAQRFFNSIWFWSTCAACAVIGVLCVMLFANPPVPDSAPAENAPVQEDPTIPEQLQICKDALDAWQALDSYQIEATAYRYYNSKDLNALSQWTTAYWVDGENWVYMNHDERQLSSSALLPLSYMYRDGNLYKSFSADVPTWTVYSEKPESVSIGMWPMTFQWDAQELMHLDTTRSGSCDVVRFAVIDRSEWGQTTVIEVRCNLTLSGILNSITVIQSTSSALYMNVYELVSTDADEISQFIADQITDENIQLTDPVLPMD